MLGNQFYYFASTRKYISIFGSLFNDLMINRTDKDGNVTQMFTVPVQYAQKEKMMVRLKQDPDISRQDSITLPRMSFFLDGLEYDPVRKMNTVNKTYYLNDDKSLKSQFESVPYNFYFSLYVYVKNNEDGTKIIEQILPFFTPEFSVKAFLLPNHESFALPIELRSITHEDSDTIKFTDNSALIWTLRFCLRGHLFCPIKSPVPLVLDVNTAFYYATGYSNTQTVNLYSFGMSNDYYMNTQTYSIPFEYIDVKPNTYSNGSFIDDWTQNIVTIGK